MIRHISIDNFAIIEHTEIDLDRGLSAITGETGAGKSVIIEAVSLALGSRADSSFVRHGAEKAVVQLLADIDDEEFVITREISPSGKNACKNICRINGELATLGQVSKLAERIADIHGQYDNQLLHDASYHLYLVDHFQEKSISSVKARFTRAYNEYKDSRTALNDLLISESENKRKEEFYRFEIDEINAANLKPGEDNELEKRVKILKNIEKIFEAVAGSYNAISAEGTGALDILGKSEERLSSIREFSPDFAGIADRFSMILPEISDATYELRRILDTLEFTPDELDNSISRLQTIEALKRKYNGSIDEILKQRDTLARELDILGSLDEQKKILILRTREKLAALKSATALLSAARKESAKLLSAAVERELIDLNFVTATFEFEITKADSINANGGDECNIMISTNQGEPLKPLTKIASGGEISRIMLAIKNVTGTFENMPTMIFDEIDSGISGITASIIARKLKQIAEKHQIICVTHLAQIAAAADINYRIFKTSDANSTRTQIERLNGDQVVDEIARLIGGNFITENTRTSARELIEQSR